MRSIVATGTGDSPILSVPGSSKDEAVLIVSADSWGEADLLVSYDKVKWVNVTVGTDFTKVTITKDMPIVVRCGLHYMLDVATYTDDITLVLDE